MPLCAAVSWNAVKDQVCNFKCSSDPKSRTVLLGEQGVLVRAAADFCAHPPPLPPAPAVPAYARRIELYDHREDTRLMDLDAAEFVNVAAKASNLNVVTQMRAVLRTKVRFC